VPLPVSILTEQYIAENDVGCGDEVITAGLPVSYFGRNKNVPIVRTGHIAAMPEEDIYLGERWGHQRAYLIEGKSIGGLSGSPVFLHTPAFRRIDGAARPSHGHQTEYLMGVHIGLFETRAGADNLRPTTEERRANFLEAMSSGIGIVIPVQRVIEIIEKFASTSCSTPTNEATNNREYSVTGYKGRQSAKDGTAKADIVLSLSCCFGLR
jgi:hypothetical protein